MNTVSRRGFLKTSALGAMALPAALQGAEAERKLKIGLIGCGWYGMVDLKAAHKLGGVETVALCDVDSEGARESLPSHRSWGRNSTGGNREYLAPIAFKTRFTTGNYFGCGVIPPCRITRWESSTLQAPPRVHNHLPASNLPSG